MAAQALARLHEASHSTVATSNAGPCEAHAAILEAVQRIALHKPRRQLQSSLPKSELPGKLQPSMRRAMRIVAHPHAFFDGYFPEELKARPPAVKTRRKMRRVKRRKKRAVAVSGFAGLEQRAVEDATLLAAVQELKCKDSLAKHASAALLPQQRVRGANVDAEALGLVPRADGGSEG